METSVIGKSKLYHADCLEVLKILPDCSIDAMVTDPPAGIGFMGKDFDTFTSSSRQKQAVKQNASKKKPIV